MNESRERLEHVIVVIVMVVSIGGRRQKVLHARKIHVLETRTWLMHDDVTKIYTTTLEKLGGLYLVLPVPVSCVRGLKGEPMLAQTLFSVMVAPSYQ